MNFIDSQAEYSIFITYHSFKFNNLLQSSNFASHTNQTTCQMKISRKILGLFLILLSNQVFGLNYYWVGGSGNWSDINHWSAVSGNNPMQLHTITPTSSDNVILDSLSFPSTGGTININLNIVFCKNLIIQNIPSNVTIQFSGSNKVLRIFGDVDINDTINWNGSGLIKLEGIGSYSIRVRGLTLPNLYANSVGSTWELLDSLHVSNLYIENGTFKSNSNYLSASRIEVLNNSFLNLDSSSVDIKDFFYVSGGSSVSGFGSVLTFINSNACYKNLSNTLNTTGRIEFLENTGNFVYTGNPTHPYKCFYANSNCEIGILRFHKNAWTQGAYQVDTLHLDSTSTLEIHHISNIQYGYLIATGTCTSELQIKSESPGQIASFAHTSSSDTVKFVSFRDISISNSPLNAVNYSNLGNSSSGIIGLPNSGSTTYHWIGGSGNWLEPSHWSLNPGGTPAGCIPNELDTVVFSDSSSTSAFTVTLPTKDVHVGTLICTNSNTLLFAGGTFPIVLQGSLYLNPNVGATNVNFRFVGSDTTLEVQSSGTTLAKICFDGTGAWRLLDNLEGAAIYHNNGKLDLDGHQIVVSDFQDDRNDLYPHASASILNKNPYLVADSSTIKAKSFRFTNNNYHASTIGSTLYILEGNPLYAWPVWPSSDKRGLISTDSINWNRIFCDVSPVKAEFNGIVNAQDLELYSDVDLFSTVTVDSIYFQRANTYNTRNLTFSKIDANGDCTGYIDFTGAPNRSWDPNGSTNQTLSYCVFKDVIVQNGSISASNSIDISGNSGIAMNSNIGRTLFWVGSTGDWADTTHWSLNSGGVGGQCIPTPSDSIVFDTNSGISNAINVNLENPGYCKDIYVASNAPKIQILNSTGSSDYLNVFGDVAFFRENYIQRLRILGKNQQINLRTKFSRFDYLAIDADSSEIRILDSLKVQVDLYHHKGSIFGNGNFIGCYYHYYGYSDSLINPNSEMYFYNIESSNYLDVSGSKIVVNHLANFSGGIISKNSIFEFIGNDGILNFNSNDTLNKVVFYGNRGRLNQSSSGRIQNLLFSGDGTIGTNALLDTLIFSNGHTYYLPATKEVSVSSYFDCDGDFCNPILLRSTTQGVQSNINLGDTLSGNFLEIRDLKSTGLGPFYAGIKSADQGNNTNLIWANKPGYVWGFGPDKFFITCNGSPNDSVTIYTDGFEDAIGFTWFDGSTGSTYKTNKEGMYWVEASYGGCTVIDTIVIIYDTVSFNLQSNYVCVGDTVHLSPVRDTMSALVTLLWNDGSTDFKKSLVFTQDTTIWVQVTNTSGHSCVDTVQLSAARLIVPDSIHLLNCKYPTIDTSFVFNLLPAIPDSIYFTLSQPFDSVGFTYHGWVYILAQYCSTIELDSIYVSLDSSGTILPKKTEFCLNSPVTWSTTHPNSQFLPIWMNNSAFKSENFLDTITGNGMVYFHRTDDVGCTCGDTLEFMLNQTVSVATSGISQNIMGPYSDTLQGYVFGDGNAYRWYLNGSLIRTGNGTFDTLSVLLNSPGTFTYSFVGIDTTYGCQDSTSFTIIIASVPPSYFPTSFTPNGDGINDLWVPVIWTLSPQTVDLKIYNKWGSVVYQSYSNKVAWNGNDPNGNGCEDGPYVVECKYLDLLGNWQQYQGWVLVIRP